MIETLISIENLQPNPYNPRKTFEEKALEELAKSISEIGLLQPLVVYPENGHHVVVCGDRRLQACKLAGIKKIPCREIDPPKDQAQAVQIALTENLQRADLSTAEEATAIYELIEAGAKRAAIARTIGKSAAYVSNRYLLAKHEDVLKAFVDGGEKDLAGWAIVAKIDDPKIRKNVLKTISGWSYGGPTGYKDDIESAVRLQNFEDLEEMVISDYVCEYENKKQHIMPCLSGYGENRYKCPQYAELNWRVKEWMGLKGKDQAICANDEKQCLEYKRQAEEKVRKKVEKVDKSRLLDNGFIWAADHSKTVDMRELGDKACGKCKDYFKITRDLAPQLKSPYRYCMAKNGSCFDVKKKAYDKEFEREKNKSDYISGEGLEKKTDEELQQEVLEIETNEAYQSISYGRYIKVLLNRGLYPVPSLSIEWRKFDPPEECTPGCICHAEYEGELKEMDLDCFDSCPHLDKEEGAE